MTSAVPGPAEPGPLQPVAPGQAAAASQQGSPEFAALLSWLVPGLGHVYLGDWFRGLLFAVAINAAFAGGLHLSGFAAVNLKENRLPFFAQVGCGSWTVFAASKYGAEARQRWYSSRGGPAIDPLADIGLLYTILAGLLNFLVIQDAFGRAGASASPAEDRPAATGPPTGKDGAA